MIRYKDFKRVALTFPAAIREYYFKPCTFLRMLVPESMGAGIYIHQFYNYVSRRVTLFQSRLELSRYDEDKDGRYSFIEFSDMILSRTDAYKQLVLARKSINKDVSYPRGECFLRDT